MKGLNAMEEKAVLTQAQVLELQDIDEESKHGDGWCDVSDVNKDMLKELEKANYVVTNAERTSGRITGMGRKALENHVIRGSAEHGKMLLARPERTSAKPYESVMRKENGDIPVRPVVEQTITKSPKRTCIVDGCDEPRLVRRDGVEMSRCAVHHKENLGKQVSERRKKKDQKILTTAGSASSPQAAKAIEADERTLTHNSSPPLTPPHFVERGTDAACGDCGDCVYREVLDTLRAKLPGIDEMVYFESRMRELRKELGI